MENSCLFISTVKERVLNCKVAIYSFLDKNTWFIGDIIISSPLYTFTEDEQNELKVLYNKIWFFDEKEGFSLEDSFNYVVENCNCEHILKLEDDILFLKDIQDEIRCDDFIVNIKQRLQNNENLIENEKFINLDNNVDELLNQKYNDVVKEMISTGPQYKLNIFDELHYFHKDFNDRHKYVLCVCAKNENNYIIEWIEHYLGLGFDKIFICDNNEIGDNSLYETIKQYVDSGIIEIFDCKHLNCFQVQFYSMFCIEGNHKWCGYFDADEFLEIPSYFNIKHYLDTKKDDICISFHWMVYGSNGKITKSDGLLCDRFKYPVSPISIFTENCFIKSIVRGNGIFNKGCWFNGSHIPMSTPMYVHNVGGHFLTDSDKHCYFPPKYKDGYIRHYYTKSFDEWVKKSKRGWPDGTDELNMGNFFVCTDWSELPLEKMTQGLFTEFKNLESTKKYYRDLVGNFDVINIENDTQNIYGLMVGMYNLMQSFTGYVFILGDSHIDDTVFNLFLEYGIRTGNKVVWAESIEEKMNVVNKYSKTSDTYFNINFK